MTTITPLQLNLRLEQGEKLHLIDVRTPTEFEEIHVPGAHLAPLDHLDASELSSVNGFAKDGELFILCRSGGRAKLAAERLEQGGYQQCSVVEGGTMAWMDAGLPVNHGITKAISLERQVRIAAGSLVLIGVILSYFVHPAFLSLSGVVGAGLIFAGLSDWCGLGMLLARMPWNQRASSAPNTR